MDQRWKGAIPAALPPQPAARPAGTGQPTGNPIQQIGGALLADRAWLMALLQALSQIAQQGAGQPPQPPTGAMPGGQ